MTSPLNFPSIPQANPFNADDYQRLQDAERALNDLLPLIEKAERCGNDCSMHRGIAHAAKEKIDAYKREFFAGPEFRPRPGL